MKGKWQYLLVAGMFLIWIMVCGLPFTPTITSMTTSTSTSIPTSTSTAAQVISYNYDNNNIFAYESIFPWKCVEKTRFSRDINLTYR